MTAAQLAIAQHDEWWRLVHGRWKCSCPSCVAARRAAREALERGENARVTVRAWRNLQEACDADPS